MLLFVNYRHVFIFKLLMLFALPLRGAEVNAVTEIFYPYQTIDENHILSGYSVDVVNELAEIAGDELNIEVLPWSVAYQQALSTKNLMIFSIGKNQKRSNLFHWVGSIAREELYFWVLSNSGIPSFDYIEDYSEYRFAVVKDATTHQFLSKNGFNRLYPMGGTDSNAGEGNRINMLFKSRADIVISVKRSMHSALELLELPRQALTPIFRATELDSDLHIAFSLNTEGELLARYKTAMETLKASEKLTQLQSKWRIAAVD